MDKGIHLARFLGRDILRDVKAFDLARDMGGQGRRIESRDTANARTSVDDIVPSGGHIVAHGETMPKPVMTTRRFTDDSSNRQSKGGFGWPRKPRGITGPTRPDASPRGLHGNTQTALTPCARRRGADRLALITACRAN